MGAMIQVSDESFEDEVLKADKPVLVYFGAEWCGPCKMLKPIIERLADECVDKLKVVKVDIDKAQEVTSRYGIRGVPTLVIFRNGEKLDSKVGAVSQAQLEYFINQYVSDITGHTK